jgi:transcriptional regulator with XRE-family HTH domain
MDQSTSNSSIDAINKKFQNLLADKNLNESIQDARLCNDIAIDLYTLRVQAGLTQKELAEKLGVKQSNISRWEQPGYQGYKVKGLSKIVRMLGGKLELKISKPAGSLCMYINYIDQAHAGHTSANDNRRIAHVTLDQYKPFFKVDTTKRRMHA